jgi:hypothetical protein
MTLLNSNKDLSLRCRIPEKLVHRLELSASSITFLSILPLASSWDRVATGELIELVLCILKGLSGGHIGVAKDGIVLCTMR